MQAGSDVAEATRHGATLAGIATVVGAFSNATTATLSDRLGRTRTIVVVNAISFGMTLALGFTLTWPWGLIAGLVLVTVFLSNADSAVISTTLTETVPIEYLGRTLAVYSFLGFTAGSVAPLAFGAVLDFLGQPGASVSAAGTWPWGVGFATLALGSLVALIASVALHRRLRAHRSPSPTSESLPLPRSAHGPASH
jgi:MFS family permease